MAVSKEKKIALLKLMEKLHVQEGDLEEKFVISSGKGGQNLQKTSNCVYLKHIPSEIEVKCQKDRSRELNRFLARRLLCEKLEEQMHGKESKKQLLIKKIQKQKKRRARKSKSQENMYP